MITGKDSNKRTPWMQRHLNDPWVREASQQGWRSRAVFKLEEIDRREKLIRPGMTVIDLGAAPGGWSQYATKKMRGNGTVIAVDRLPMDSLPDVRFIQGDFTEDTVFNELLRLMSGKQASLVLSDMAPNLSGMKAVDQPRAIYLAELAMDLALRVLEPPGSFLVKVFQGEGFDGYLKDLRDRFERVSCRKPAASRAKSREIYLLAKGIRPAFQRV